MVHLSTYTLNTGCSQNCSSLMKETDRRKDHNTESNSASSSELTTALSPMTSGYSLRTPFIEKLGLGEVPLPELVSGTGVCPQGRLLGKKKCQHSSLEAYTYGSTNVRNDPNLIDLTLLETKCHMSTGPKMLDSSLNEYMIKRICVVREGECFKHRESIQRKRGEGERYCCAY
ncbi:uncharacterized protein AAES06_021101 isoform 1-T4 [Glossophaga mutica]